MADFNVAIGKLLAAEGDSTVTNTANDKGGTTKYGISKLSYPNVDIANLTQQQAEDIYFHEYWLPMGCNLIDVPAVAEAIFGAAVNMGVKTTSRLAQLAAGYKEPDGFLGPETAKDINSMHPETFLPAFALVRIARYAHICNKDPSQAKFMLGWVNRVLGGS